jgi:hypothetical protein
MINLSQKSSGAQANNENSEAKDKSKTGEEKGAADKMSAGKGGAGDKMSSLRGAVK